MPPAVANGAPGTEFVAICHHILNYLTTKVLAPHQANIFKGPVDPGAYPDYHQIITNPMWFDKIVDRLNSGYYKGPEGFYEDMLALLDNCYTFNVEKYRSEVGTWGITMEIAFLKAWAKTPFAATVPPRNPRPLPNPTHVIPPKRPGAAPRAPRARPLGAARGRPGRPAGSFARTKSVNSYGAVQQPTMTQEMTAALVNALNNPEILNANLQTVVEILRQADELGEDEDGEATLDLEKITPPTAMKLYNLVVARRGVPASGGYRMEEDDDDYDPEEEDD